MTNRSKILSVIILTIALAAIASPAAAENGWVSGEVNQVGMTIFGIQIPGDAIPGATVQAAGTSYSGTTNSAGEYNFSLPAGNYTLQASASGYNTKSSDPLRVMPGSTTTQNFILETPNGNLTGSVTDADDGTPVQMVMISYDTFSAFTDSSGKYLITGLPVGALSVNLTALPPYNSFNFTAMIRDGKTTTKELQVKAVSYISVIVKDGSGKPIAGATLTMGNYSGTTDAAGLVMIEVRPGDYEMQISATGYNTIKKAVKVEKGDIAQYEAALTKPGGGGGGGLAIGGLLPVLLVVVIVVVVVGVVGFLMMRKRKAPAPPLPPPPQAGAMAPLAYEGPAPPGQPAPYIVQGPPLPPPIKTQEEKIKEWADYERMYGRPHPEAPGWVSGASAFNVPKPKCPVDDVIVSYEPYSGQYFCSKCRERYSADKVFPPDSVPPQQAAATTPAPPPPQFAQPTYGVPPGPQPAQQGYAPPPAYAAPQPSPYTPVGPQEQPSWATQTAPAPPPAAAPAPQIAPPAPAAPPPPPVAAPIEAQPVADGGNVPEATMVAPEGVPPTAGPIFNLPPPKDYDAETEQRPPSQKASDKPPESK